MFELFPRTPRRESDRKAAGAKVIQTGEPFSVSAIGMSVKVSRPRFIYQAVAFYLAVNLTDAASRRLRCFEGAAHEASPLRA
jgi:hypothetical protein